jgi:hypothetical protein
LHQLSHLPDCAIQWSTKRELFVTIGPSRKLKGVVMTTEGHIAALERRHQELDRQIQSVMQNRKHDHLVVSALKRRKLELKDELSKLTMRQQASH